MIKSCFEMEGAYISYLTAQLAKMVLVTGPDMPELPHGELPISGKRVTLLLEHRRHGWSGREDMSDAIYTLMVDRWDWEEVALLTCRLHPQDCYVTKTASQNHSIQI